MATRKRERFFALFFALLFLLTSSALVIALIVSGIQNRHQSDGASSTPASSNAAKSSTTKLTGTVMKDYTPTSTPISKLSYTDTTVGTGAEVKAGDTITADYTGWLSTTGVIFDASADHGGAQTFSLNGVIAGWSQAIPGMRIGGTRRLFIPASLGYGSQGSGSAIPPNSDLVFDVTIQAIGQ